ncbi:hypothetical protein CABS01_13591 [Colletotrichum abscissum]|uniref:uncharacterized protein n=1 Tax=Colletotrichum abscissum TaxID=1671311 RepID=UPI0027D70449|nr:uncharacterized protein CABS01_13591 [Colletotrichum abscissum]KAK1485296.1 hypothetical protein CABS01_13591 [Colletotrichum abscissum]
MTSLSIPSQLSQLPNHREREDKVNVQTPGPVAGFSVAASFKLEAELTPPSPPLYALRTTLPYHLTYYPVLSLPSPISSGVIHSLFCFCHPVKLHSYPTNSWTLLSSFFFLLTKVLLILQAYAAVLVAESSSTPPYSSILKTLDACFS